MERGKESEFVSVGWRSAPLFCHDDEKSELKGNLLEKKHFPAREE